jgi:UDP-glucose 4-epimerase
MRTVVTGGAGFIGSNLVDALLARGDSVTVVDNFASGKRENLNPAATLLEHDIREPFSVEADVIFHLAAQADVQTSMQRPEYDAAVNVVGTVNVLGAAPGAQVIFTSSGGAGYGECTEPATEQTPFLPLSPYGIAKKCGEEYLAGWNRIHRTQHVSLRFANVYGPRQDSGLEGGVVAIFLERLASGGETVIFGDGTQARDFVYVDDIVDSLLAAAGRAGGPYNVGTGRDTTVAGLHAACVRVAGVNREPRHEPARLGDVQRSVLDAHLIERELGWRPRVSLDDGLGRTWAWMKEQAARA